VAGTGLPPPSGRTGHAGRIPAALPGTRGRDPCRLRASASARGGCPDRGRNGAGRPGRRAGRRGCDPPRTAPPGRRAAVSRRAHPARHPHRHGGAAQGAGVHLRRPRHVHRRPLPAGALSTARQGPVLFARPLPGRGEPAAMPAHGPGQPQRHPRQRPKGEHHRPRGRRPDQGRPDAPAGRGHSRSRAGRRARPAGRAVRGGFPRPGDDSAAAPLAPGRARPRAVGRRVVPGVFCPGLAGGVCRGPSRAPVRRVPGSHQPPPPAGPRLLDRPRAGPGGAWASSTWPSARRTAARSP
jgi:hypothetical protein